jgi:two-component system response regulator ChvI
MTQTIALVDDDRNILTSISMALEREGFKVQTYIDAETALVGISRTPPDLAVIDIKMPRMDGEELLKRLRKKTSIPIIFLTSKDEEIDELLGLKLGADDFIKKSGGFSIKILIERIRVQLRKKNIGLEENKNLISHGKLKLDPSQLECEWDGKPLPDKLTTTEFLIVKELSKRPGAKRPGVIKERSQLMDIAYKENTDIEDRTIDSHVKRIRKKFKKIDSNFSAIETRYGSGYRWNVS